MPSLAPVFESLVLGSLRDYDYDFFDKRSLRATSELPTSAYIRSRASVPRALVQRAVSLARDVVEEEPILTSKYANRDYLSTISDSLDRSLYSSRVSNQYSLNSSNQTEPGIYSFRSAYGYTIPLYRRKYPSSYLYSSPTYSPRHVYESDYASRLDDDLYSGSYGRRDPYISSSYRVPYVGQGRLPFRDWRTESPYRSYSPYRPRYIHPTVRSSYLYPKYV